MPEYVWRGSDLHQELFSTGIGFICRLEQTAGSWCCDVMTDYATLADDHREIVRKLDELNGEDDR